MKLLCIVGARPNFIKIAPLFKAFPRYPKIKPILVHTGQHYDYNMSRVFFRDLRIPRPDIHLGVGSGSHSYQTAEVMKKLEPVVVRTKPDVIVVVGDVNSTLAGALVAVKLHIPLAHIEAGLRSFDRTMPEEINRVVTDTLAELLFVPGRTAVDNLRREGIDRRKIFVVGNIMVDALKQSLPQARQSKILSRLHLTPRRYGVVTLHRAGNVDNKTILSGIIRALVTLSRQLPLVFPVHPRTQKQVKIFGMERLLNQAPNLRLVPPVGYLESLQLLRQSRLVLTDSGGVQEETTCFGVPCLTLREQTEWLETTKEGTNQVVGVEPTRIQRAAGRILKSISPPTVKRLPRYWDGRTAERIISVIAKCV